jgi:hypothetical protein
MQMGSLASGRLNGNVGSLDCGRTSLGSKRKLGNHRGRKLVKWFGCYRMVKELD